MIIMAYAFNDDKSKMKIINIENDFDYVNAGETYEWSAPISDYGISKSDIVNCKVHVVGLEVITKNVSSKYYYIYPSGTNSYWSVRFNFSSYSEMITCAITNNMPKIGDYAKMKAILIKDAD